jgi:hypothetical protein
LIGVMYNVLMNMCTHCSQGMSLQASSQLRTWSFGKLRPVYLTSQLTVCDENCAVIKVQHCVHSMIFILCVPHHLFGVDFKASSISNNLYCVGTLASKSDRKVSKELRPSNVGKVMVVVSIQQTSLVNLAHLLVDNSYIWFYQFSNAYSKFD